MTSNYQTKHEVKERWRQHDGGGEGNTRLLCGCCRRRQRSLQCDGGRNDDEEYKAITPPSLQPMSPSPIPTLPHCCFTKLSYILHLTSLMFVIASSD